PKKLSGSVPVRFALLAWPLKEAEVNALCERLRAPGEERELALLACRCRPALRAAHSASPQALLELLKRADAFRRPERFKDLLAGLRLALFLPVRASDYRVSGLDFVLLALSGCVAWVAVAAVLAGFEGDFNPSAVPIYLAGISLVLGTALLVALAYGAADK